MSTPHLTRGLPGSGKSTFARAWTTEDPEHRLRVNRDDVRAMVHAAYTGRATEEATTTVAHSAIRTALRNGRDVIVDDTNLNAGIVKGLLKLAEQTGADVEFHDFPISLEAAVARDANRAANGGRSVGADVITKMHLRYLAQHKGQMPPTPALAPRPTFKPYTPIPGTPKAVVVDIDGTLARNDGHRSFYDYSEKVLDDDVHRPIADLVRSLHEQGYEIVLVSGRDEVCKDATERWLAKHDLLVGPGSGRDALPPLFMRMHGDNRDDALVKIELFDAYIRDQYDVRYVLDDRNRVVRAWRSIGLTVLQVADGDF